MNNSKPSVILIKKPVRLNEPVTNVTKDRKVVNFNEFKRKLERKRNGGKG